MLWKVGVGDVWEGTTKIGWWLLVVVALGGLRFLRAVAWSAHRTAAPAADREAFKGVVAGDTVGNATPLGPVLGEPAKAAYARGTVRSALTALAIETCSTRCRRRP